MKHPAIGRLLSGVAICVLAAAAVVASGLAQAAPTARQALWQQVTQSRYVIQGASDGAKKATVYAFFDPNCIFCHLGWELSRHYYAEGLQVRWIPIAFLTRDSASKAAWVLLSADPSKALAEGEGGWKGQQDGGGAFKEGLVTDDIRKVLDHNKKLFVDLGLTGTPGFVYEDSQGVVHTTSGISSKHMFADMTGLPPVPVDDPALANIPG